MAMGLTGKITPYKNLFGPFPGEVYHAPFPIEYHGVSVGDSLTVSWSGSDPDGGRGGDSRRAGAG